MIEGAALFFIGLAGFFILGFLFAVYRLHYSKKQAGILRDSIDALDYGLIFFDEKENFYHANNQALRFFKFLGNDPAHTTEKKFMTLKAFLDHMYDHAVEWDQSLGDALNEQSSMSGFREVIKTDDNTLCLVELKNMEHGGKVLVLQDLSGVKRDKEDIIKLSHYSYELTEAVEASNNGIVITNLRDGIHTVVFANKAFCEQATLSREEIIGRDILRIFDEFGHKDAGDVISKALDEGTTADVEIKVTRRKKNYWYNLKLTPVWGASKTPNLYIGVSTDTTELKIREAEFFQAQKLDALGRLAAGVAHDFNNVLSIVDGYARIAAKNWDDREAAEDYMEKIRMASSRGADLTKQMLTFSRHKIVSESVIDLGEVIREQEVLMRPIIDASINFSVQIQGDDIYVECPSDSITQIMMNLVINARDAMKDGGHLIVGLRHCDAWEIPESVKKNLGEGALVCLYVSDTGCGMDSATQERMFDPFFTTKEQGQGTGLGLSMAYGLIKQIGGYVDVSSSIGQGTTFSIYLPQSDQKPNKKIEGSLDDVDGISLAGYTAVLAEDEPDLLLLVREMLEKLDMTVISAANGNEALLRQENHKGNIDLLLTDVVMPELDGVKLAELFCSLRPEAEVIFMSGYPANGKMARVQLPDGAYFMAKPIEYETLARLIFETLTNKKKASVQIAGGATPRWESSDVIQKSDEAG